MNKVSVLGLDGNKIREIDLPGFFSERIREDLIFKVLESKKRKQPYAPNPMAGKQTSASGKIRHRRKVWKTHYGRGMSRVPRKVGSRRGSQFMWEGAFIPSARGGLRAHPPKILEMLGIKRINKKEMIQALKSALSATASEKEVAKKYSRIEEKALKNLPLIVDSRITEQKTKDMLKTLKAILGEDIFNIAIKKKSVRSGRGKLRGRKYKSNAGMLLVTGNGEKVKTTQFEVANANNLSITELAKGGQGRLTVYTEKAINELNEKLGEK